MRRKNKGIDGDSGVENGQAITRGDGGDGAVAEGRSDGMVSVGSWNWNWLNSCLGKRRAQLRPATAARSDLDGQVRISRAAQLKIISTSTSNSDGWHYQATVRGPNAASAAYKDSRALRIIRLIFITQTSLAFIKDQEPSLLLPVY